jgi:ATP-dependent Clp protease ATP-binding subunit ClpB
MTSNLGDWGDGSQSIDPDQVRQMLRQHFRPEFLNRIDATVVFHGLTMEHLVEIVGIQLERLNQLLAERRMQLSLTPAAQQLLAERGYDPAFGARPVKRTIQQLVQDPLAMFILEGQFRDGDQVQVDRDGDQLIFSGV